MTHKNQLLLISIIIISIISWTCIHKKSNNSAKAFNTTIIVGTNAEYPPFSFIENNTIVGLDIDIIKEVAHRLHKQIVFQDMPFDALMPQVQLGSIQVIAAGMTPSPERAKQVFFTSPHISNDPLIILSMKNNQFATVEDLHDKRVVVNEGYTADYYISGLKIPNITRLSTVGDAILALQNNRVDAFVTAKSAIQAFINLHGDKNFNQTIIPNTQENYALIVSKKHPELFTEIKKTLEGMEKDGTVALIKSRWYK